MNIHIRFASLSTLAFVLIFLILASASDSQTSPEKIASHLSWTSNNTRYDFVFNTETPIKNLVKLSTDSNNFLTNSLIKCTNTSACLFRNGTFLESFQVNNSNSHKSIFDSRHDSKTDLPSTQCDNGNKFTLIHYCSTHWNPPVLLSHINCKHAFEWHSPLRCHSEAVNHEHPCYIYGPSGELVDLTPWILSNGSSYRVDKGSTEIEDFHVNVCNEAHDPCGPNVSACFIDKHHGLVETGYNNLTSIKYDFKNKVVLLTSLGLFKQQCEGNRMKTVIRFTCKDKNAVHTGPKLIKSSACENTIEWPTVRACPLSEVQSKIMDCKITYEPLGIDVDIRKITSNRTIVEVPNINIDGIDKKMILGLCQGIPKSLSCEGKLTSTTSACLVDAADNSTARTAKNSQIVGSVIKSSIKLADERIYLESFATNKTCIEEVRGGVHVVQQVGTRVEFYCSQTSQELPTFLGYDDCMYIFEWGSPNMCLETYNPVYSNDTKKVIVDGIKDAKRTDDVKEEPVQIRSKPSLGDTNKQPRMDSVGRFFMISLIVMTFAAFLIIILVLDKKTRLRVTLRRARQAFQTNQPPYSRVISDLDL